MAADNRGKRSGAGSGAWTVLALSVLTVLAALPVTSGQAASGVPAECIQAGKPHVEQAVMLTPGRTGQIIGIEIHYGEWPPACAGLKRIEQYQIMIKGKHGLRPFSPPFFWNQNGAYTSNEAGAMGGSFKKPPNSPESTVRPGEKALLTMRERIQRTSDKKILAEVVTWHKSRTKAIGGHDQQSHRPAISRRLSSDIPQAGLDPA